VRKGRVRPLPLASASTQEINVSKKFDIHFTVTGRDQFPTDMLRYDECKLLETRDNADGTQTAKVVILDAEQHKSPHSKRWQSFGWPVDGVSIVSVPAGTEGDALRIAIGLTRLQRAQNDLPSGWARSIGTMQVAEALETAAENMARIATEVRRLFEELRGTTNRLYELEGQRDAVRAFFGTKQD
jgi:hypothetical protein